MMCSEDNNENSSFSGVSFLSLNSHDRIRVAIHRVRRQPLPEPSRFTRRWGRRHSMEAASPATNTNNQQEEEDPSSTSLIIVPRTKQVIPPPRATTPLVRAGRQQQQAPPAQPTPPPARRRATKKNPQFRLPGNLIPALQALRSVDGYAGTVLTSGSTHRSVLIQEQLLESQYTVLPEYIESMETPYTEHECRLLFKSVCERVHVLHANLAVHRDLHLGNVVYDPLKKTILLRGLQHAAELSHHDDSHAWTEQPMAQEKSKYNWFAFRAPELDARALSPRHGTPVDVWSLGACLYMLLTGLPPFRGSGSALKYNKMTASIAPYETTTVPSDAAQALVARLLNPNPRERPSVQEILESDPWMNTTNNSEEENDLSLVQTMFQDWHRRWSRR